jgi:MerR family redox-sensitive transcriptional activator SoxR
VGTEQYGIIRERTEQLKVAFTRFVHAAEIGEELAKLPADHVPSPDDWAQLSGEWLKRIDERAAELERLREGLTNCIGCGCLSFKTCWIANPQDRRGRAGPGPRSWV